MLISMILTLNAKARYLKAGECLFVMKLKLVKAASAWRFYRDLALSLKNYIKSFLTLENEENLEAGNPFVIRS